MTERDAFMAAIVDTPHDDTARRVYADYLTEWGDEVDAAHGVLIREQIGGGSGVVGPDLWRRLVVDHIGHLVGTHKVSQWPETRSGGFTFTSDRLDMPPVVQFRRGFPDRFRTTVDEFVDAGADVLDALPTLTEVSFHDFARLTVRFRRVENAPGKLTLPFEGRVAFESEEFKLAMLRSGLPGAAPSDFIDARVIPRAREVRVCYAADRARLVMALRNHERWFSRFYADIVARLTTDQYAFVRGDYGPVPEARERADA